MVKFSLDCPNSHFVTDAASRSVRPPHTFSFGAAIDVTLLSVEAVVGVGMEEEVVSLVQRLIFFNRLFFALPCLTHAAFGCGLGRDNTPSAK